jgi:hypothetical protein
MAEETIFGLNRYNCLGIIITRAANESSRAELVKRFELKNLAQTRLVTIRASSQANAYALTQFDI